MLIAFMTITAHGQNKLLSSIQEYNNNDTWEKRYGTNYEYDSNNNLIAETGLSWVDGVWKRRSLETYSYNASNKLTQDTYEDWNPDTNEVDYKGRSIYSYTNGKLTGIEGQEWKDSNWVNEYKITATYNSNNLPEVVIEYSWISSQWVNEERTTYTYNANNKIISSVFEEWTNAQWVNSEKTLNTYNTNNKLILSRDADWDDFNNDWTQNGNKIELMWDTTGNKTQNIDYYSSQGTVNQYKNEYTYDLFATMSSYAHPFKDKTGVDYLEEDFPYVNKVLNETSSNFNAFSNSYVISSRTTYNYNGAINLSTETLEIANKSITVYPNPTTDFLNIQNDANTAIDKITITDVSGKKVLEQSYTTQVNVQNLPKGMYVLEVFTGQNKETRKFIKD